MKLLEALRIANHPPIPDAPPFSVSLGCGFTPLHFKTLLAAHLQLALPNRAVRVHTGTYGDLHGTLESLHTAEVDQSVVLIEWPDIDPRLGLRQLGGWTSATLEEILREADQSLTRIRSALSAARSPVVLVLPTLPLLPVAFTTTLVCGSFDLELQKLLSTFASELVETSLTVVLNAREIDRLSPPAERHDVDADLLTGFPYSRSHADILASLITRILVAPAPKRGLISDLDDTLWLGIIGDDGVDGISWDLDHKSQMHGVYQQLLRSLADSGALVGIATKNDRHLVEQAFDRSDIILRRTDVYPIEAHWEPKSKSITRILNAWNIGGESVVFIDDNPMELAEVKAAHPDIESILFPKGDSKALYALIHELRDRFGKRHLLPEDRIRAVSLRTAAGLRDRLEQPGVSVDSFLQNAEARIVFSYSKQPLDPRILELINKTNQFNLNGRRYLDGEWQTYVSRKDNVVLLVRYEDKYGPLGKIAVVTGCIEGESFFVHTWVMSCRAFSRRIEYQTLREIFEHFGVTQILLDFLPTDRNAPVRDLLSRLAARSLEAPCIVTREEFEKHCPALYHLNEQIS